MYVCIPSGKLKNNVLSFPRSTKGSTHSWSIFLLDECMGVQFNMKYDCFEGKKSDVPKLKQ